MIKLTYWFADRYVMLGNHRDAWVFGALDPLSGTAAMMEISRVLGNMLKKGTITIPFHQFLSFKW